MAAAPFDVIYARVDVIRDNAGQLAIMELEMVEPGCSSAFTRPPPINWPLAFCPAGWPPEPY